MSKHDPDPLSLPCFVEKAKFKRRFRDHLFEILRFTAHFLHVVRVCGARCGPSQALFPGFHEAFGSLVIDALRHPLTTAKLSFAVLQTQTIKDDPDLFFR